MLVAWSPNILATNAQGWFEIEDYIKLLRGLGGKIMVRRPEILTSGIWYKLQWSQPNQSIGVKHIMIIWWSFKSKPGQVTLII